MSKTVSALYDTLSDAHSAVLDLSAAKNFDPEEINVVSEDAMLGSLTSTLVGMGIDEEEAARYTEAVHRGSALVLVRAEEQHVAQAMLLLKQHNPIDIDQRAEQWRAAGWSGSAAGAADGHAELSGGHLSGHTSDRIGAPAGGHLGGHMGSPVGGHMGGHLSDSAMVTRHYDANRLLPAEVESEFRDHLTRHPPSDNSLPCYADHRETYAFGAWLGERSRFDKIQWEEAQADAHKRWAQLHNDRGGTWEQIKHRVQYGWHRGKAGIRHTSR